MGLRFEILVGLSVTLARSLVLGVGRLEIWPV